MRGSAVTGALARSAELAGRHRPDLRPVRFTADLSRAASMDTVVTRSTIGREGGRLMLVDTELLQLERVVARARTLFLAASGHADDSPPWSPVGTPVAPPQDMEPATAEGRLFYSEECGWHPDARHHRNNARKQVWCKALPVVEGEEPTPFATAAAVADLTNLVTQWGTEGVRHINADVTLVLARDANGPDMGLSATGRVDCGGPVIGSAEIYDSQGVFGCTSITALTQTGRSSDTFANLMRVPTEVGEG